MGTRYFQQLHKIDRSPDLDEAVYDICTLLHDNDFSSLANQIRDIYYELGSESVAKCVTKIWTLDTAFTKMINSALIVDGAN